MSKNKQSSEIPPKVFGIIGLAGVGLLVAIVGVGFLMPAQKSESYAEAPRELTKSELANRCAERFYGEMGRQCIRDIYRDNEALPKEYQYKTRWGVDK